ncbi:GNAT family N-acetyltransferase, partial [Eggerthella sp.]
MSAGRPAGRFVLETERLLLREMGQSDLAALCAILQDDETMYAYEGALSDDEAQAWLDRQMERYARDGFG